MYEKFGQFIDGKWQQSSSGETYEVINPATEEIIGKASKANSKDIQRALKSAEKGLEIWRNTPPWERSKVIRRISELMRKKVGNAVKRNRIKSKRRRTKCKRIKRKKKKR